MLEFANLITLYPLGVLPSLRRVADSSLLGSACPPFMQFISAHCAEASLHCRHISSRCQQTMYARVVMLSCLYESFLEDATIINIVIRTLFWVGIFLGAKRHAVLS